MRFTPKVAELFNIRTTDKGRPLADLTNRISDAALEDDARQVLRDLVPVAREVRSDAGRWYAARTLPYRSAQDRIEGVVITLVDIHDFKEATEALRRNENRLRKIVNIEGVGLLTFDESGRLLDANDMMLRLLGYSREEFTAQTLTWRTLTPAEYIAISEVEWDNLARVGRIGPYEKEILHRDGSRSWFVFAGASVGDGSVVEYCVDIGARKTAEEALRLSDRRKDEFLATLAHELRNPLAPIVSGIEALSQVQGDPARVDDIRKTMQRQSAQIVRLVDDLLDMSRITEGRLLLRRTPVVRGRDPGRRGGHASGHRRGETRTHCHDSRRADRPRCRCRAPDTGRLEPARQRREVYAAGRTDPHARLA